MSKLPNALQAIHFLLVRIRYHSGTGADQAQITLMLDHAEYLMTLVIRGKEDDFRRYLQDRVGEFPEFAGVLQRFDESPVAV